MRLHTLPTRFIFIVFAAIVMFTILPYAPVSAESAGALPSPPIGEGGVGTGGGSYMCASETDPSVGGNALWQKNTYDNWGDGQAWVLVYPDWPFCHGADLAYRNPDTSVIDYDPCTSGFDCRQAVYNNGRATCTAFFDVYRFYGPPSDPARYMSRSVAEALTPCQPGEFYRFFTPHPHDAGSSGTSAFTTTYKYTTTDRPVTSQGCPVGDDDANLAALFSTEWETEAEADLASQFRQAFGEAYTTTLRKLASTTPPLPTSVTNSFFNSDGYKTYAGDDFRSISYPDGIPCSSGLDFAVHADDGVEPWLFGVCFAPVSGRFTELVEKNGAHRSTFVDRDKLSWNERGVFPFYDVSWLERHGGNISDSIISKYRARLSSSLGSDPTGRFPEIFAGRIGSGSFPTLTSMSEVRNRIPCYWGQGAVINDVETIQDLEPVDPIPIIGPDDHLAYVGGLRTRQQMSYEPQLPMTCNGGQSCTQGQALVAFDYSTPNVSVPSGWTQCTGSNNSSCDYKIDWTQRGYRLDVTVETFTATRPGQAFTVTVSATAIVEYPGPATDTWLTIDLPRTWAWQDVGLGRIDISASNIPNSRVQVATVPKATRMPVAGSHLTTEW